METVFPAAISGWHLTLHRKYSIFLYRYVIICCICYELILLVPHEIDAWALLARLRAGRRDCSLFGRWWSFTHLQGKLFYQRKQKPLQVAFKMESWQHVRCFRAPLVAHTASFSWDQQSSGSLSQSPDEIYTLLKLSISNSDRYNLDWVWIYMPIL